MKTYQIFTLLLILSAASIVSAADSDIRLNSLGFPVRMPKKATIIAECSDFQVKKTSDNSIVYSGKTTGPQHQDDIDQNVWIADFSEVTQNGKYYLDIPDVGRSIEFEINDKAYNPAFYTVMRGFYLWRCGTTVEGEHHGIRYSQKACHLNDAYQDYSGFGPTIRDGTGGWHDAGDYGKYTVNAGITLGCMFMAWDHFQDKLKDVSLDLPDTAPGFPDYLKELKWETDWLLKMQYPDGSGKVSHKLTRLNFSGFIMPSTDTEKRYFTDWSSAAAADFVAVMAMAARYFKPYDADYASKCLEVAIKSYNFLSENPDYKRFRQGDFQTGGYQTQDSDDRLWAAAEMWETTGRDECLQDFEERATVAGTSRRRNTSDGKIDADWDWGNVRNLGMFTYALSKRDGRNPGLLQTIKNDIISTADSIAAHAKQDVYARPLVRYYWGCNGTVARQVLNLQVANIVSPNPDYINTSLDAISHLFGRNYYGRSYVTGLGSRPPVNPHDRRSGADGIEAPWPGYLVGGGHSATGWHDEQEDYRTNEIAVNWQAALVYALAGFTNP